MKNIFEYINDILSNWDPLDVGEDLAQDEYQKYIPSIVKRLNNKRELALYLECILTKELNTGYNKGINEEHPKDNDKHRKDLDRIIHEMLSF